MYFVVGFPQTQKQNGSIWVVGHRLTKSAYFIPVNSTYSTEYYASIFIDKIVCRHGILLSIILHRGNNSHLGFGGHSEKGWAQR